MRGDLPSATTTLVEIPLGAGEALGTGVRRLTTIQLVRDRMLAALAEGSGPAITIGGDCGVELAAVGHVLSSHPESVAVVWLDAHADLNTPQTSRTGAFHGMVLRTLLGEGGPGLVPPVPLDAGKLVLAGARALDDAEAEFLAASAAHQVSASDLTTDRVLDAVRATGATAVYLHVDLDVLDPSEFASLGNPEPFGLTIATVLETITALVNQFDLVGAGITEFAPSSVESVADDMPTILRILGALTARR